jgi:hypothetical protein
VALHIGVALWLVQWTRSDVRPLSVVVAPLSAPAQTQAIEVELRSVRAAAAIASVPSPAPAAPTEALPAPSVSAPENPPEDRVSDGRPTKPTIGVGVVADVVRGLDARGPQPTLQTLAAALDYEGRGERNGQALSDAGRAQKAATRVIALADAAGRPGHTWLTELGRGIERRYAPEPRDLSNPKDVSREKIITNYLLDVTHWDDDAREALSGFYEAEAMHSQDPIKRLAALLPAAGSTESPSEREQRLWQLISKREQGMAVRFAFPVEVHHDGDGRMTAVDVRLTNHEQGLDRLIRSSITAALQESPPAPPDASGGQPFISHWVITSTWFMDPPRLMFGSTDAMGAQPGDSPMLKIATRFDVTKDGVTAQDFDVHRRIKAELTAIEVLRPDGG